MKALLLTAIALLILPALAWADSTDPQIDPNNCTGSFQISTLSTGTLFRLDPTTNTQIMTFIPLVNNGVLNQPDACLENNTGATINSLTVTGPQVAGTTLADYSCPTDPFFASCTIALDPTTGLVTYDFFGGTGIAAGGEFGFIDPGFASGATFGLATPEPGTLTLLGTLPALALWRWRKKK